MVELASSVTGDGPEMLLIHGGMTDGKLAWGAQAPLASQWSVKVVDRAGYGSSAALSDGEDIELDARLIAAALASPVHLVGHSSGAIVAMLAAALAPSLVRSLTVVEPPSYRFLADPAVQALADAGDTLWDATELSDREWLQRFFEVYGEGPVPAEILELLAPHVRAFRGFVRRPYDIDLPIETLQNATFPILVVSGGHTDSFELLNDRVAEAVGGTRAVIEGAGHEVQMTGPPFNELVDRFCAAAEAAA